MAVIEGLNARGFYHGTKADLKREDLIKAGSTLTSVRKGRPLTSI
ncbi:MAG: hypothetical protein QOJ04_3888 [Caballeronia sp.]|nr:hypothetical protein [Caballeronia sp.]